MPSSSNIIQKQSADTLAINYEPVNIGSQMSEQALEYAKNHESRGDFRVDKIVSEFVGIDQIEKEEQQREVANEAIKLSKDVQETAYKEAYDLGLKEGKEHAFNEEKERIASEMENIKVLISEIKEIKTSLMKENEKEIVNLCFYMAKRLLMKEVETDEAFVKNLIKKTLEMAQSDEEVTIRLSESDKKWIDQYEDEIFKDLNLGQDTRFEEDKSINPGGVVIETNHGVIDATVEQRLEKLETIIKSQS